MYRSDLTGFSLYFIAMRHSPLKMHGISEPILSEMYEYFILYLNAV